MWRYNSKNNNIIAYNDVNNLFLIKTITSECWKIIGNKKKKINRLRLLTFRSKNIYSRSNILKTIDNRWDIIDLQINSFHMPYKENNTYVHNRATAMQNNENNNG